ncbi:MAG: hypothetical protein WB781_01200 [Candidatus Sulfotelmatobacter sp.]
MDLSVGGVLALGLWGCCEKPGVYLDIQVSNPSVACFYDTLNCRRDFVTQEFKLCGQTIGKIRVNAVAGSGTIWDWFDVTVQVAPPPPAVSPFETLAGYVKSGRLTFNQVRDKSVFEAVQDGTPFEGKTVRISDELIEFLNDLAADARVNVMSMYRYNQSMHGDVMPDGTVVCRAVDIAAYGGSLINLEAGFPPETVIHTVAKIIDHLPATTCQIGFPRPRRTFNNDSTDFIPELDVFFPVPDEATARLCLAGKIGRDRSQLKEPARTHIMAALARAESGGTKFKAMYPDGKDHCCIFALP